MPREFFADTWFFIAFSDRQDSHHRNARRLSTLASGRIVTHDAVLTEFLSFFAEDGQHVRTAAVATVRNAFLKMNVVPTSGAFFTRALDLYERRTDKGYSLVDCMSMEVMLARGITHVLTNDHHFRQEGFTVLSDAP
jgi:predicted nucleic acid-binding protein